jgi:hypothetical protein
MSIGGGLRNKLPLLFWFLSGYLIVSYGIAFFLEQDTIIWLVREDGVFESLGASAFLGSAILFFVLFAKHKTGNDLILFKTQRNLFYLMLGLLFFFIFGEEISWGQRILNLRTPEFFEQHNIQDEINLHNLKVFNSVNEENEKRPWWNIFSMSRLFRIFWFFTAFLIPILNSSSFWVSRLVSRLNFPVFPIWLGIFFPLNYLVSKIMEVLISRDIRFVEIEETSHGVFFLVAAYCLYVKYLKSNPKAVLIPQPEVK